MSELEATKVTRITTNVKPTASVVSRVVDQIVDEPGGTAALYEEFTVPVTGYMVGGAGATLVFSPGYADVHILRAFVAHAEGRFLGWWTDSETDRLYVDQVTWTPSYETAERLTLERGEIAFYDIERGREFRPVFDGNFSD